MKTRKDIQADTPITIPVRVDDVDHWNGHEYVASRVTTTDIEDKKILFTVFNNDDLADFDWQAGEWYLVENARGNIYQGERQLKTHHETNVTKLDAPPDVASDNARTNSQKAKISNGNYLSHFPIGSVPELEVNCYSLKVAEGFNEEDLHSDQRKLGFTNKVAYRARLNSGAPTTSNGPMQLYAVNKLPNQIKVDDYTVEFTFDGVETIYSTGRRDRQTLEKLIKQDIKQAIPRQYKVHGINDIQESDPCLSAGSGDFTANRSYACYVNINEDGLVTCGVDVKLRYFSEFSAAEYVKSGHDIQGVRVRHNPYHYRDESTGIVIEKIDEAYSDPLIELGGTSLAKWHNKKNRVDEDVVEQLRESDTILARIRYNSDFTGTQALDLCNVTPKLDELKILDPDFHRNAQIVSRMSPDDRFSLSIDFIEDIGPTPALGLDPVAYPTNEGFKEFSIEHQENLRFKNEQLHRFGRGGLDKYGVYQPPNSLDILALYPERFEREANKFVDNLESKFYSYEAPASRINRESYTLGSEFQYINIGNNSSDYDCAVVVVPDKEWVNKQPGIDDPFHELKRKFGQQRLHTQMVQYSSLTESAYLGNIAAGIIGKSGGIPWRIDKVPGNTDVFIGLDVTYDHNTKQHLGASGNIILADGSILASKSIPLQKGETFEIEDLLQIVKDLLGKYINDYNRSPNHIVFHKDGKIYFPIDKLVNRLESAGDIVPRFDLVEVKKSGNPRIASYNGSEFTDAGKGVGFKSVSEDRAYITTTGTPEKVPGTPRPIRVNKRFGPTDIETLARQAYWLSEMHIGSISRSTRMPITTYYADLCATHALDGYMIDDELIEGVPYI